MTYPHHCSHPNPIRPGRLPITWEFTLMNSQPHSLNPPIIIVELCRLRSPKVVAPSPLNYIMEHLNPSMAYYETASHRYD